MVPRGGVHILTQAPSVLITRTNPRVSGYRFTVNRHRSYYPNYYPKELAPSDMNQTNSMNRGTQEPPGYTGIYIDLDLGTYLE